MSFDWDEDALIAGIELAGRSGATRTEFGHLDDDVPIAEARWWAKAQYNGAVIMVEDERDPVQAVEALARRILKGAMCNHCKRNVALRGIDPGTCRWTREGKRWIMGCER